MAERTRRVRPPSVLSAARHLGGDLGHDLGPQWRVSFPAVIPGSHPLKGGRLSIPRTNVLSPDAPLHFLFGVSAGVFAPISYSGVACVPFGAGFRIRVKLAWLDDWEVALLLRGIVDINARCRRCRPRSCSSPARGSRVIFLCRFFPLLGSTLAHPFSITSK